MRRSYPGIEARTAQVNLRLRPSLVAAAKEVADHEGRSLTALIEHLLTACADSHRAGQAKAPAAKRKR